MDERREQLRLWAGQQLKALEGAHFSGLQLTPASSDASFRRYFRVTTDRSSYIAMDAPPDKEDSSAFVAIARAWKNQGICVPELYSVDLDQGFLLIEDFGGRQLLTELKAGSSDYTDALHALVQIQTLPAKNLPLYDQSVLMREMELFPEWFIKGLLGLDPQPWRALLEPVYQRLIESALQQTQVCVHRDYHSRNLIPLTSGGVGVIDFQDALIGPVTYDLMSLLRDAYIDWSDEQVATWVEQHRVTLIKKGLDLPDAKGFMQDFDWIGMQRQLKVVGIFSRLWLRDEKSGYLKDIPRTFNYLRNAAKRYPEFAPLAHALDELTPIISANETLNAFSAEFGVEL